MWWPVSANQGTDKKCNNNTKNTPANSEKHHYLLKMETLDPRWRYATISNNNNLLRCCYSEE